MKNINFEKTILLSKYTTIKVGGFAEYFSKPNNTNEFINLIKWSHINNQECRIIGAGSNLVIRDNGIDGIAIITNKLNKVSIDKNNISAFDEIFGIIKKPIIDYLGPEVKLDGIYYFVSKKKARKIYMIMSQ